MKELIVKLRAESGYGMMDCKEALRQAEGDYEKAKVILENIGLSTKRHSFIQYKK